MKSEKASSKKLLKKEARQKIYDKLVVALSDFKTAIKKKKFEKKLRRTSKLFAVDLLKSKKDKTATAKIVKKKSEDKTEDSVHRMA